MEPTKRDAELMNALAHQRNVALDTAAQYHADLRMAQLRIAELEEQLKKAAEKAD